MFIEAEECLVFFTTLVNNSSNISLANSLGSTIHPIYRWQTHLVQQFIQYIAGKLTGFNNSSNISLANSLGSTIHPIYRWQTHWVQQFIQYIAGKLTGFNNSSNISLANSLDSTILCVTKLVIIRRHCCGLFLLTMKNCHAGF